VIIWQQKKTIIILTSILIIFLKIPNLIENQNKSKVPKEIKETILISAQSFFENKKNIKSTNLEELINRGYIKEEKIEKYNCNNKLSTIKKERTIYNKYNYKLSLFCKNKKSELSLSE